MDLNKIKSTLEQRGFEVFIVSGRHEINKILDEKIPISSTVGFGGSVTLRQLGIDLYMKGRGNVVHDHWEEGLNKEELMKVIKNQPTVYGIIKVQSLAT